jgi:glucose/arabinose dehydrogenase
VSSGTTIRTEQHLAKRIAIAIVLMIGVAMATWAIRGVDAQSNVPDALNYTWVLVSDGFDNPIYATSAFDGSNRMFVVEQTGLVWIVNSDGSQVDDPFLDISAQLPPAVFRGGYSEQGLLGLAFHPNYEENGLVYISYTDVNGDSVISSMNIAADDANRVDPSSERVILTVDQPFENHNSGHIVFGQDGYLYISFGDGGDQGDPFGNAQNPQSLLGKVLRIDVDAEEPYGIPADNPFVDSEDYAPEVWQMGLRNPWRFSFDRAQGDFYLADVGEWQFEEINFLPAGTAGANFGWEFFEGTLQRDGEPPNNLTAPILTYDHSQGCSVTGGYVYRGEQLPEMQGYYFYGDYCLGNLWIAQRDDLDIWQTTLWMPTLRQISSFGEDERGELYMVDYKGELLRLEAAQP